MSDEFRAGQEHVRRGGSSVTLMGASHDAWRGAVSEEDTQRMFSSSSSDSSSSSSLQEIPPEVLGFAIIAFIVFIIVGGIYFIIVTFQNAVATIFVGSVITPIISYSDAVRNSKVRKRVSALSSLLLTAAFATYSQMYTPNGTVHMFLWSHVGIVTALVFTSTILLYMKSILRVFNNYKSE